MRSSFGKVVLFLIRLKNGGSGLLLVQRSISLPLLNKSKK